MARPVTEKDRTNKRGRKLGHISSRHGTKPTWFNAMHAQIRGGERRAVNILCLQAKYDPENTEVHVDQRRPMDAFCTFVS